jgi:hypothetical protein
VTERVRTPTLRLHVDPVAAPRTFARFGKALFVSCGLAWIGDAFDSGFLIGVGSLAFLMMWFFFAASLVATFQRRRSVGALVVERPEGASVEVQLVDGDRLVASMIALPIARSVVEALGFGPRGTNNHVRLARRFPVLVDRRLADLAAGLVPAITLAVYQLVVRATRPTEVTVGDAGVAVAQRFWTRTLDRRDALEEPLAGALLDRGRCSAVMQLVRRRLGEGAPPARLAPFARGGLPFAEWRTRLGQGVRGGSYRGSPITEDDAREALRSGAASPDERIGAALALRVAGEPPEQLRVAAASIVDRRLRVAIEAVAADDDAAVEEALRRLT